MRHFLFYYTDLRSGMDLKRKVILSKSTGNISIDAKNALGVFINSTGTLKYINVNEIQELDKDGNAIGEPIKPMGDNAIVPTKR